MARSRSPSASSDLISTVVAHAATQWNSGTRVCVAYSGGSDSTVLLHALAAERAKKFATWTLTAHHVHHGLSPNAGAWAAHCEAFCAALDVPFSSDRVVVDTHAGSGMEAAAREARLESLDRVTADIVVLAHHARDQAETLLLQLLRGSGPPGMAAMPVTGGGRYLRPLLSVPKGAISEYVQRFNLSAVVDESNADNRFSRNRLRNTVWPALASAFPAAEATLVRAAQHQADAATLLDDLADIDAAICLTDAAIALAPFNLLSDARRANLLRFWLQRHGVKPPATDTLREWLKQLGSVTAIQAIELRGNGHEGVIRVYRGQAHFTRDTPRWQPRPWAGEASLELKCDQVLAGEISFTRCSLTESPLALRAPVAGEKWLVRLRQDGDAVKLSERSGHVALKNIFQQANIPPWQRATWPLLVCNDEIAAVASIATAKAFNVAPGEPGRLCGWKPA